MKKYNLSNIMKDAWKIYRETQKCVAQYRLSFSECLKGAWKEAKEIARIIAAPVIEMKVARHDSFTVNTLTGVISGKTYTAKEFIKSNFKAIWDGTINCWITDPEVLKKEITENARYYKKYVVDNGEIVDNKLINCNDGFYSRVTYSSGKVEYAFVG